MKRIFCDTEFTGLTPDPKLISIALVAENGDEFYVELVDTYRAADLTEFAAEHVVPLLQGGKYDVTFVEAKARLRSWIEQQGLLTPNEKLIIATDSLFWDWPWVMALLDRKYPDCMVDVPLMLSMNYLQDFDTFEAVLMRELAGLRRHHARDDAIANFRAWKESGGDVLRDHTFDV